MHKLSFSFSHISDTKKKDLELDIPEIESKERLTRPDYREVAVQVHSETTPLEITG